MATTLAGGLALVEQPIPGLSPRSCLQNAVDEARGRNGRLNHLVGAVTSLLVVSQELLITFIATMFILCGFKNLGDVDVEISCLAQYVGHPLELGPDRLPPLILDNGLEQSDGGAEPSQGNPHLVDGISLGHVSNNGLVGHQVLQAGCADSLKGGGAGHLALEDHRRRFDACGSFLGGSVEAALSLGLEAQAQRRYCRDCQGEPKQIGRCALLELKLEAPRTRPSAPVPRLGSYQLQPQ